MAAALQATEDGWLGRRPRLARLSRGWLDRTLHVVNFPFALALGSYTGVLIGATGTMPSTWEEPVSLSVARRLTVGAGTVVPLWPRPSAAG